MKPLEFSDKSWHYRPAKFGNQHRSTGDICSYTRSVLTGLLLLSMALVMVLFITWLSAHTLAWLAAMVLQWSWIMPLEPALILPGAALVVAFMALLFYMGEVWDRRKLKQLSDSFVPAAVSSYVDKFCVPVKILDSKKPSQGE